MRLGQLKDVFLGKEIYIVGTGPTAKLFPLEFLTDKVCIGLNDAYKMHPAVGPVALMHHVDYARQSGTPEAPSHPNFSSIKYPVVKVSGRARVPKEDVHWDHPHFYLYDWSHDIAQLDSLTKETDYLLYTPEGCSLHAALQLAWILGASAIYTIGCDSRTFGGKHYADYDKNGFRAEEALPGGLKRNYDSYVYGTLVIQEFLGKRGIPVFNLSPMVGYHLLDYQYDFLSGLKKVGTVFDDIKKIPPVGEDIRFQVPIHKSKAPNVYRRARQLLTQVRAKIARDLAP
jgi:hypothetical protein